MFGYGAVLRFNFPTSKLSRRPSLSGKLYPFSRMNAICRRRFCTMFPCRCLNYFKISENAGFFESPSGMMYRWILLLIIYCFIRCLMALYYCFLIVSTSILQRGQSCYFPKYFPKCFYI